MSKREEYVPGPATGARAGPENTRVTSPPDATAPGSSLATRPERRNGGSPGTSTATSNSGSPVAPYAR